MNVHDFDATTADGGSKPLSDYAGRTLLIVNVASKCGLTPQCAGLETLHQEFGPLGLQVLGFPCNQFGGQEPGTDEEIQGFCSTQYDVTFPVFAKIDVNGPDAAPLFAFLRARAPGEFGPGHFLYEHIKSTRPEAIDSDEVNPGDSMPNRLMSRGMPWADGPAIKKSAAGSPGPVSFGLMPQ